MTLPLILADAAINPYLAVALDNLLEATLFLLVPVIALLGRKVFLYLEKKFGFEVDDAIEAKLQGYATDAVLRAGLWARSKVKLGEAAPSGAQKLDVAINYVQAQLQLMGYDTVARDKLVELIEGALAKQQASQSDMAVATSSTTGVPDKT